MVRPRIRDDEAYLTIRMDKELKALLEFEANRRDVSMNFLVVKAVRNLLYRDLIPIDKLTKEKEADNERAANQDDAGDSGSTRFDQYQRGV